LFSAAFFLRDFLPNMNLDPGLPSKLYSFASILVVNRDLLP